MHRRSSEGPCPGRDREEVQEAQHCRRKSAQYAERRGLNFTDFVQSLAASGESRAYNPAAVGMEVHETHPVCLGGSPTDPANKVLVPPTEHAELCRFWNSEYGE